MIKLWISPADLEITIDDRCVTRPKACKHCHPDGYTCAQKDSKHIHVQSCAFVRAYMPTRSYKCTCTQSHKSTCIDYAMHVLDCVGTFTHTHKKKKNLGNSIYVAYYMQVTYMCRKSTRKSICFNVFVSICDCDMFWPFVGAHSNMGLSAATGSTEHVWLICSQPVCKHSTLQVTVDIGGNNQQWSSTTHGW